MSSLLCVFHRMCGIVRAEADFFCLGSPLKGSAERSADGHYDVYKLLNSSFLLLQSMAGAFLAARF